MNHEIKILITAFFGMISSLLGVLYVPALLMVLCNVIDYITGLMAAKYRDGISSYKSVRGIKRKVSMWLLVVIGGIMDHLIVYSTEQIGFELPFNFLIASVVAIWIMCNEIISILENMVDIGVTIPPFLMPLIKYLKSYAEKQATIAEDKDNE